MGFFCGCVYRIVCFLTVTLHPSLCLSSTHCGPVCAAWVELCVVDKSQSMATVVWGTCEKTTKKNKKKNRGGFSCLSPSQIHLWVPFPPHTAITSSSWIIQPVTLFCAILLTHFTMRLNTCSMEAVHCSALVNYDFHAVYDVQLIFAHDVRNILPEPSSV